MSETYIKIALEGGFPRISLLFCLSVFVTFSIYTGPPLIYLERIIGSGPVTEYLTATYLGLQWAHNWPLAAICAP